MSRFSFNVIKSTDKVNISKITENFDKIESNGALNTDVNLKAPINHAVNTNTYGLGTSTVFGHVKIINSTTSTAYVDGEVLSAYQGKILMDAIKGKQKTITSGTAAPSGGSNGDIYIQYF